MLFVIVYYFLREKSCPGDRHAPAQVSRRRPAAPLGHELPERTAGATLRREESAREKIYMVGSLPWQFTTLAENARNY